MKRLCAVLICLMLVLGVYTTASAAGSVTYDGDAKEFIFAPGTENSPDSLFENFRDVMPGDTLTEQILIKNDASNGVKIKVYMRSLGAQENTNDYLSKLNLRVEQMDDSVLFDAPADDTAQLTDWVCLGTVYSGGEIPLDVTLEVPVTLGDDYQKKAGYIDWEFKVEELPIESDDPKPPQTGDGSNIFLYIGLAAVVLAALVILFIIMRRKKEETD